LPPRPRNGGEGRGEGVSQHDKSPLEKRASRCSPPHPSPLRAPRRRETPVEEGSIQITVDRSGSWRANVLGDWGVRSLATKAALGGRAIQRAVMSVNLEQASKVELRMPTGGRDREGSMAREAIDASTCPIRRGSEDGTLERC